MQFQNISGNAADGALGAPSTGFACAMDGMSDLCDIAAIMMKYIKLDWIWNISIAMTKHWVASRHSNRMICVGF